MSEFTKQLEPGSNKEQACASLRAWIEDINYEPVETNEDKPWGAYYRFDGSDARRFVEEFFPGLSYEEACLGKEDVELSPKFLLVQPQQRLSWQYHDRRAERWRFLTDGYYYKSMSDEPGDEVYATAGESVQFAAGERHRLCAEDGYVVVAEIWQHIDPAQASDENDIVRLEDDYSR